MNTYTDTQLKQALAKMLPDKIELTFDRLVWQADEPRDKVWVQSTELLHLCWLVEETLDYVTKCEYMRNMYQQPEFGQVSDGDGTPEWIEVYAYCHATWQQRTVALCKVKGIDIGELK